MMFTLTQVIGDVALAFTGGFIIGMYTAARIYEKRKKDDKGKTEQW